MKRARRVRPVRGPLALFACGVLAATAGGAGASVLAGTAAASPAQLAGAGRSCKPPAYPSVGYFDSVTVTGTTCATGSRLVLAYFKCRTRSGLAGRCRSTVLGFKCTETRNSIPTEIDARDTCRRSHETVISVWQQDIG